MAVARQDMISEIRLREAVRRRNARNHLDNYCRYIEIPGAPVNDDEECERFYPDNVIPAKHHRLINEKLEQVDAGKIKRLMIFMPPGSAKSTYASVVFPTWFMGRHPGKNIISTSYGSDLAKKFGRKCRQITRSGEFLDVFNSTISHDNKAVDNWALENGSTYMSGGILSGITGNRADGLVIDDPVKGREEAESQTMRDKIWEAYLSDLRTRLKPSGWIVIIQTRWHADDLSGRILPVNWDGRSGWVEAKDGEKWFVISLPAQCNRDDDPLGREHGEYLWTDWFSQEHWEQEKKTQGSRNWSALYQQSPTLEEGGIFPAAWFNYFVTEPADYVRMIQSWDTAQKENEINDFSVCTTWIQTRLGYFLIDVYQDRLAYPALKRAIKSKANQFNPSVLLIEDKGSGISAIQDLAAETDLPIIGIEPEKDKVFRAMEVSPLYEAGLVYHQEDGPWLIDYETELTNFPNVDHDDQTDSTTQALKWMRAQHDKFEFMTSGNRRGAFEY